MLNRAIVGRHEVHTFENMLGPAVTEFVDRHVHSLLTWDILTFFHHNPDAVLDIVGLASRLDRRVEEIEPEVTELCVSKILSWNGGLVRYQAVPETRATIAEFVEACQDRTHRLALIALVLGKIPPDA